MPQQTRPAIRRPLIRAALRCAILALALGAATGAQATDPCADWVPQAKPQNASRDIVGQDIDQILDRGFMTFAVYADYPPYSWREDGALRGVDVEIARLIAEDIGVEARFTEVAAGENLEADLRFNIWQGPLIGGKVSNVMMRVPYDSAFKCRVDQVEFTGQYAAETIAIAYSEAAYPDEKPVPAYFRFDTVAVENDSISDFYLSGFAGGQLAAGIRRYPDMVAAMDALARGEVMAAMGPLGQLEHGLRDGIGVHTPPLAGLARSRWTLGTALHFRYKPLGYMVDDAVRYALEDGRIAAIYESYGLTLLAPER
ncbi:amino acid ABC transporter substrate-binding protein [Meridianimarinicoccus roseus]|jgi:ABC-type amino acid transport substrate-binding protein|uniref:Amino acid ABC transporter substrate-binding protein n=1 Tax=Meridianimarinicoccus roseus TaxID=2072018 RepID=A0A2V2LBR2_9RHOB|nr:transporter substrate-binding domain-containing protein [Meridianimarinicoccus roseus]PWR02622.1 amino acid ABC transporter substrate-binding protein [Meridianimarinicoccus roseus]